MIKNYKQFESLLDNLTGPSREDAIKYTINSNLTDNAKFFKFIEMDYLEGITKELLDKLTLDSGEHGLIEALSCGNYDIIEHMFKIGFKVISEEGWIKYALKTKNKKLLEILKKYIGDDAWKFLNSLGINESLLDKLQGPSEEEIWNQIKDLSPNDMLKKSAELGIKKWVEYAINKGADVNLYSVSTSIIKSGDVELLKYIISEGFVLNNSNVYFLNCAIISNNLEMVKFLIDEYKFVANSVVHTQGYDNKTSSLDYALSYNNTEIINYLIDKGADINSSYLPIDKKNRKPLWVALLKGNSDVVKKLLEMGADTNFKYGTNNLMDKAVETNNAEIVHLLLQYGIGPETSNRVYNNNTIDIAIDNKNLDIIILLIEYGHSLFGNKLINFLVKNGMTEEEHKLVYKKRDKEGIEYVIDLIKKYFK